MMAKTPIDTLVKICGVTCAEDARFAMQAGASLVGLNLVAGPRQIDLDAAKEILGTLDDPTRAVVLVSVNDETISEEIAQAMRGVSVRLLQLYGNVTPRAIRNLSQHGFEIICPWSAADYDSIRLAAEFLLKCGDCRPKYLLFDAAVPGKLGGTGSRANWQALATAKSAGLFAGWPPIILAGGLTADCVGEAISGLEPFGVDVSSGVETSPGKKEHGKIAAFVAAVAQADCRRPGQV